MSSEFQALISQLENNIQDVSRGLDKLFKNAADKNKEELADLQVEQQLKGKTNEGLNIEPEYSPDYAQFKGFSTPNLNLEGDFHSGVYALPEIGAIEYGSTDEKAEKLEKKYDNIFGIAPENLQEELDIVDPDFKIELENELFKGL